MAGQELGKNYNSLLQRFCSEKNSIGVENWGGEIFDTFKYRYHAHSRTSGVTFVMRRSQVRILPGAERESLENTGFYQYFGAFFMYIFRESALRESFFRLNVELYCRNSGML